MLKRRELVLAGMGALAAPSLARAQARTAVTVQIDGAAVPFYAPLYAGVEKGFFGRRGLDLRFVYANAADIVRNVAAGNVEFGFPNADSVVAARANDIPVKVVHTTYQRGIGATLFKRESGIRTMADLRGKRVAVTALGSPNHIQLQVGLRQAGLTINDVRVEVIATGAIVQALQAGQVDAIVFSELRRFNLEADGVQVGMISSNDFLPSFGNVVVAGERLLRERAAVARGFIDGLDESLQWIIAGNVEESLRIAIDNHAQTWRGQEAMLTRIFREVFVPTIWQSEHTRANGLGYGHLPGWQRNIDIQAEFRVIDRGFPAEQLVVQPRAIS